MSTTSELDGSGEAIQQPLRLAISPCPNDTFIFHALIHGRVAGAPPVEVSYADVDVTNTAALTGAYDLIKVSYAALPWLLDLYEALPCGGAVGRGCGPLIVARQPLPTLVDRHIAVPGERTTAYLLLRLWLSGPAKISVRPFASIMPAVAAGEFDAGLVIHEARFTYQSYGLHCLVDLGDWWEHLTGLPIPLGVILARHGTVDPGAACAWIQESLRQAWADPQASRAFVASHAQHTQPEVIAAHIGLYVNSFTFDLGDTGRAAVAALLQRAAAAGLTRTR
jgi:1,4-dihydroxy-6-naphthoate synthase